MALTTLIYDSESRTKKKITCTDYIAEICEISKIRSDFLLMIEENKFKWKVRVHRTVENRLPKKIIIGRSESKITLSVWVLINYYLPICN